MSNVTEFKNAQELSIEKCVATLDLLREKILNGEIKAFAAVGLAPDHATWMYTNKSQYTTKLELMGAIQALAQDYWET